MAEVHPGIDEDLEPRRQIGGVVIDRLQQVPTLVAWLVFTHRA